MWKPAAKKKWLFCSICLVVYLTLSAINTFHNAHIYGTGYNALVHDLPHRNSNSTSSMDAVPVVAPDGRVTSLLKPEKGYVVPNVVHYIWYGDHEPMKFHQYLSVRSVFTFLQPDKVIFHYNQLPVGGVWQQLQNFINQHNSQGEGKPWILEMKKSTPPSTIHGREITLMGHKSDIARIQILMDYGGIFLDLDVIAVRSFDPLRRYNFTMGIEYFGYPGRLNNGIILSRPRATFLYRWLESYNDFSKSEWDFHSSQVPYELQFEHPELIHVENQTLNYPSGKDIQLIYEKRYDWSHNYALHLWYKIHDLDHGPIAIRTMNTTFGEVTRLVFYGSQKLLPDCKVSDYKRNQCPD